MLKFFCIDFTAHRGLGFKTLFIHYYSDICRPILWGGPRPRFEPRTGDLDLSTIDHHTSLVTSCPRVRFSGSRIIFSRSSILNSCPRVRFPGSRMIFLYRNLNQTVDSFMRVMASFQRYAYLFTNESEMLGKVHRVI